MFVSSKPTIVAVCIAGACLASGAQADTTNGYGVATSADARDTLAVLRAVSAYRMGEDASTNYTNASDTPPTQRNDCLTNPYEGYFCTATLGGTTNPSYNLTASTSSATILAGPSNGLASASAMTYADLSTGQLGGASQGGFGRVGLTVAVFNDRLTFNIAGASATTVTNIAVSFTIDGSILADPGSESAVTGDLRFGDAFARLIYTCDGCQDIRPVPPFIIPSFTSLTQGGWVSGSWVSGNELPGPNPLASTFSGVYALVGAQPTLDVRGELTTRAGFNAIANYANTAAFQFDLPSNVSYTSASGVFLSAVPEPTSWAMLLAGLGVVGRLARRRSA